MRQTFSQQLFPVFLTIITFFALSALLYSFISVLNLLPLAGKIILRIHITDVLIGLTIYLKTSVDFAVFIGNLMSKNPGWRNRIAIEIGTALGNAAGTLFVLIVWTFFKEVSLLMILMIFLASLLLLGMAEEGIEELLTFNKHLPSVIFPIIPSLLTGLKTVNAVFRPITRWVLPHASTESAAKASFVALGIFAFTVPLILGLDDFAGYIPLFNVINVFGFSLGVFLGHMLLNIALFASPTATVKIVKQPLIILLGSLAFIGIALWGLVEIYHLTISFVIH